MVLFLIFMQSSTIRAEQVATSDSTLAIEKSDLSKNRLKRTVVFDCTLPKPQDDETVVAMAVYGGNSASTVSVAGQVSQTDAIPVQIDEGEKKLYIIASAYSPLIWQFVGHPDRISKLVLAGRSMAPGTDNNNDGKDVINIGSIGVDKDKVTFIHGKTCGLENAYDDIPAKAEETVGVLENLIGQKPDLFFSEYDITALHIFGERINNDISKQIEDAEEIVPDGFDAAIWKKYLKSMPGGVIDLRHENVVSHAPNEPYEVLPGWAGISKLVYENKIVPVSMERRPIIKIVEDIPYYPTGLYGAYSAKILISKGVEPPKGISGHSIVILEETGEQIAGPRRR